MQSHLLSQILGLRSRLFLCLKLHGSPLDSHWVPNIELFKVSNMRGDLWGQQEFIVVLNHHRISHTGMPTANLLMST